MARPFNEPKSYHNMGSLASQTSLAGPYEDTTVKAKKGPRPRLPKIKSSPSKDGLAGARADQTRPSQHKRGNSTTATPASPTFVPDYLLQSTGSSIPSAHAESYMVQQPRKKRSRTKIKPFLSKQSSQEKLTIDLSRSAAENEGLAGVYTFTSPPPIIRSGSGSTHARGGVAYHNRTTSAASQISSAPSNQSARYVHPMRQTPRPFTPPTAGSFKNSLESDAASAPPIGSLQHHGSFDSTMMPASYAPLPPTSTTTITAQSSTSTMARRPHLPHIRTGSSARLVHSASQSNLPGTPSSLRQDFASPTSASGVGTARSSFDTPSLRFRSRSATTATSPDPVAQAATVAALRQQFQEKEARKERKYAEAEARSAEKEAKRREKREGKAEARNEKRRVRREMDEIRSQRSRANTLDSVSVGGGGGGGGAESISGSILTTTTTGGAVPYASPPRSRAPTVGASSVITSPPLQSPLHQQTTSTSYRQYDADASSPHLYPTRSFTSISTRTKISPATHATSGAGAAPSMREKSKEKGEKVQSQWSLFWFRFRTAWLRFRRKMAGKGAKEG